MAEAAKGLFVGFDGSLACYFCGENPILAQLTNKTIKIALMTSINIVNQLPWAS